MNTPILHYLLVQEHDTEGHVVSEDVERYTQQEYEAAFKVDERQVLGSGKRVYRESRVKPGTGFTYADMVWATRRWHGEPTEAMVKAGVDEALHGAGVGGGRRWPDYISELWTLMRDAAL
jgi:hypothetical protein